MKSKHLSILVAVVAVLGLTYVLLQGGSSSPDLEKRVLFADIDGSKLASIRIERGDRSIDLGLLDKKWTLPSRGGYLADDGKVRSLFVRLLDLTVAQKFPTTEKHFDDLGLSDAAVKKGSAKLTLLDANKKELASLYVGNSRKGKDDGRIPAVKSGEGQFIRRSGEGQVYLLAQQFPLSVDANEWLTTTVLNILSSEIRRVEQFNLGTSGEAQSVFALVEAENHLDENAGTTLVPNFPLSSGEEVVPTVISQAQSGLENFRIVDVQPADAADAKALTFDHRTSYWTLQGLRYDVETTEQGAKAYARIHVSFDEDFAAQLEREEAARSAQASSSSSSSSGDETATTPKVSIADAKKAEELNKEFSRWVYEIAPYQATKFREAKEALVKKKTVTP